jgi:hypothetical protein
MSREIDRSQQLSRTPPGQCKTTQHRHYLRLL